MVTDDAESLRRILDTARQLLAGNCEPADEAVLGFVAGLARSELNAGGPEFDDYVTEVIGYYRRCFDVSKGIEGLEAIRTISGTHLVGLYVNAGERSVAIAIAAELAMEMHRTTLEAVRDLG